VRFAGIAIMAVAAGATLAATIAATSPSSTPSAPSSGSSTSAATPSLAAPRRPKVHSFVGEVVEYQPVEQKLIVRETLRNGSPKTTTFRTTPKTQVIRGADAAGLADVRPADHVTIKYREDAEKNKEAVTIRITPSAKAKDPVAK
jgi:hypothetical protein